MTQIKSRGVGRAVSILLLAAGAAALEAFASPVQIQDAEELIAAPRGDERPADLGAVPEKRAGVDPSTLPLPVVIDEIRGDETAPGRRPGWDGTLLNRLGGATGSPGNYGSVFGQGETLRDQLLRDFGVTAGYPGSEPASGQNQPRRSGAPQSLTPAQVMLQEAVESALRLIRDSVVDESDTVSFSVVGVDFNLTLSGGRSVSVTSDVWPTLAQSPFSDDARPLAMTGGSARGSRQSSGMQGGGGPSPAHASPPPSELAQEAGPGLGGPLIYEKLREFATDPVTMVVVLGCLFAWLAYEFSSAVRERRRSRRARRRAARAPGRAR